MPIPFPSCLRRLKRPIELKASLSALTGNDVDMTAVQMLLEEL